MARTLMNEYPIELQKACTANKLRSLPVLSCEVTDTFSMAGSKTAIGGTKLSLNIGLTEHDNMNMSVVVPLTGNAHNLVYGQNLDLSTDEKRVLDCFYASELWCACVERKAGIARIQFTPEWDSDHMTAFISVKTAKGVEVVLESRLSAKDSLLLARAWALGLGYVFSEKVFNSLLDKILADEAAKAAKKAA